MKKNEKTCQWCGFWVKTKDPNDCGCMEKHIAKLEGYYEKE